MPKITIPEHEREINEEGWECTGEVRKPREGEYYLGDWGDIRKFAKDVIYYDCEIILHRKELSGWEWLKTLKHGTLLQHKESGMQYVVWHCLMTTMACRDDSMQWSIADDSIPADKNCLSGLSPSTCEILFPKAGEK